MIEQIFTLTFDTIPQFAFAIALYWMCNRNRLQEQEQWKSVLDDYKDLLKEVLEKVD